MIRRRFLRLGFTLIELLVVVAILALLMSLAAIFFPSFQRREVVISGADSTAGALLAAKMRAKRDRKPTGYRLTVNPNYAVSVANTNSNPPQTLQFNQLTLIQQPDDFAQGTYVSSSGQTATFSGVSFSGNVNGGDYLELNGGGLLYQISQVGTNTLTVSDATTIHPLATPTTDVNSSQGTNYRVIRAAQVLTAEPTINLPSGVIFDLGTNGNPYNLTISQLSQSSSGNYDILFAPSGGLVGSNSNSPVFLGLRQADGTNLTPYSSDLTAYYATIVAIEPHTGFIAQHPVSPSTTDPFAFTRDGQSSGL